MAETKTHSRLLILSHIAQFSLARRYGDHVTGGLRNMAFVSGGADERDARPGDLVAIQSAGPSKWYLGWLVSRQWPEGHACEQYTIESIEDGELCNWSNVGLIYYDRSQVEGHPEWRWTDRQHEFRARWDHVCYKECDAYIYPPMFPKFGPDNEVELGVRVRFGLSPSTVTKRFADWRRVTKKQMREFYEAASAELAAEKRQPA